MRQDGTKVGSPHKTVKPAKNAMNDRWKKVVLIQKLLFSAMAIRLGSFP